MWGAIVIRLSILLIGSSQLLLLGSGESEALLASQREVVESLRQEVAALDAKYSGEVLERRQQRRELLRRLAEHSTELHGAACDTVQQMQVRVWGSTSEGEENTLKVSG